jgi:hypothetical protein
MKTFLKKALVFLSMILFSQLNFSQSLTNAIEQAINGKEVKFVKVDGRHEFHIKPINMVKGKGASGTISHALAGRPDDQISYKITLKSDGIAETTYNINRGGLGRMLGVPGNISDRAGKLVDGTWESSLETILNTISLYIE